MARLMRVSIVGALPTGEEWSVNPVYAVGGDFGTPVSSTQAQTIATAIAAITVPTGILQGMTSSTTLAGVRVEARAINGALESQAEGMKAVPTPGTGLSAHPFQTAIVSSLRSGVPGPRGRGRLYWPATGINVAAATLRAASGVTTSHISAVKTYLSGIEAAIEATLTGVSLCVWSRVGLTLSPVTQIQAGDVLDVQRRRRDQLVESISSLVYP